MPSDVSATENPALRHLLASDWNSLVIAQVEVKRVGSAFEIRHISDEATPTSNLKSIRPIDARKIANFNSAGAYRPLKSTPDLPNGWLLRANSPDELEEALNHLYPGALADRFALTQTPPPITNYRDYTNRQTGMYRITTFLDDVGVARVIDRTCTTICLKQRLWTAGALPTDPIEKKSAIPCLEPCAILLEAARKEVRALQEAERKSETPK